MSDGIHPDFGQWIGGEISDDQYADRLANRIDEFAGKRPLNELDIAMGEVLLRRDVEQAIRCPKCNEIVRDRDQHYVSSVGHLTDPDDAIRPYWTCQPDPDRRSAYDRWPNGAPT